MGDRHSDGSRRPVVTGRVRHIPVLVLCCLALFFPASGAFALSELSILGPERFERHKGAPTVYTETFSRCEPSDLALLKIWNGDGKKSRITAAEILVNGVEVGFENEFKQQVGYFERPIAVGTVNQLEVILKSGDHKVPAFLEIEIVGQGCDDAPPQISSPEPLDGALLNSGFPRLSAFFADDVGGSGIDAGSVRLILDGQDVSGAAEVSLTGIAYVPASILPEGPHVATVEVSDRASNASSLTWGFTTDTIPPGARITSVQDGQYLNTPLITVAGSVDDPDALVAINGTPAEVSGEGFSLAGISLVEGENVLVCEATDAAGNRSVEQTILHLDTFPPTVTVTAPAEALLTRLGRVDIAASVDEPVVAAAVNGLAARIEGQTLLFPGFVLGEGGNALTVEATDRAGNVGSGLVFVEMDSTPPAAPLLVPPATPTNVDRIVLEGRTEALARVRLLARGPGDGGAGALATLEADVEGRFVLEDVVLEEGETEFTATAVDAAGNESPVSDAATVTLDTLAPVITVSEPQDQAYSDIPEISVAGTVDEADAKLLVNGAEVPLVEGAFDHPMTLQPGANGIFLTATDPAGNTATAGLTVHVDNVPPVVVIEAPVSGLLTNVPRLTLSGSVSEADAAASLDGVPLELSEGRFNVEVSLAEGANELTVAALDKAGNGGSASVAVTLDSQPPQLALQVADGADAGSNLSVGIECADVSGLPLVELRSGGLPIWSATPGAAATLSETVTYSIPPSLPAGATATLTLSAFDAAGNQGSVDAPILVTGAAAGPGYLEGEVYEDGLGRRLEGAQVAVAGPGENAVTAGSGPDGGYFLELPSGDYLLQVSRPGYTTVERAAMVGPGGRSAALDARLTAISGDPHLLGAPGGTISLPLGPDPSDGSLELVLPPDGLAAETDLRLTPVSNQGLAGLLPRGWSPLAAVDVRAHGQAGELAFAAPGALRLRLAGPAPPGGETEVVPAAYDPAAHLWRALPPAVRTDGGRTVEIALGGGGQYALLLADAGSGSPPPAVAGEALGGASAAVVPAGELAASGQVVPAAAPPSAGLFAAGEVLLEAGAETAEPAALNSGLILKGRVTERFDLHSGETVQPGSFVQDLVLYRAPCLTNLSGGAIAEAGAGLRTTFPVSASRDFTIVDLMLGKVGIDILSSAGDGPGGTMVGADGARLVDGDGNVLEVPAGALSTTVPVATRSLAEAGAAVGDDFALLRAVEVELTRQMLQRPAVLSVPVPEGFDPGRPVVVARAVEVDGGQGLKLTALAEAAGSMLVTDTVSSGLPLSGVVVSGSYYFLQARADLGFVRGTVSNSAGNPFVGALVGADTTSLVDLSESDGGYLLAVPVAPFAASAVDLFRHDRGEGFGEVSAAGQIVDLDLAVGATVPRVVSVEPASGASGVEPNVSIVVTFSEPVDRSTVGAASLLLRDAVGNLLPGVTSFNPQGTAVTFHPSAALASETAHTLTVTTAVRDLQGYPLAQETAVAFTVRDTTPPPKPPAGAIVATFPDAEGMVDVAATQGSAEAGNTVLVVNDTSGEIVGVAPQSDGSFSARIRAQLGDEVQVVLMDEAGNRTTVSYLTFRGPDGRTLVTAQGGRVEGEGGVRLDIPEGALLGPAIVRLTPAAEAELPHPLPAEAVMLAGVRIDTGGVRFLREVRLSVPAPEGMPDGATPFLVQPRAHVAADGSTEEVFAVVDSAKVIDGRLTTASPPFAGVTTYGLFAFVHLGVAFGPVIVSGTAYRDMDGNSSYHPDIDRPIEGAAIRCPAAENFISYTDRAGHYAVYGWSSWDTCRTFPLSAVHPLTMFRVSAEVVACEAPYIVADFNIKLAEKETAVPDTAPPEIELALRVAPGQGPAAHFIDGTIPVGTELEVPIGIIDREVRSATLMVEHRAPQMETSQLYPAALEAGASEIHAPMEGELPAVRRTVYLPRFSAPMDGASPLLFRPGSAGTYTLAVEAEDVSGNMARRFVMVEAVEEGERPVSIDGAPFVTSISPGDGAREVPVSTVVEVGFSEAVQNLDEGTLRLVGEDGLAVPARVYSSGSVGYMRGVLEPLSNLRFGRRYLLEVSPAITDAAPNPSAGGSLLSLAGAYAASFTTDTPEVFNLAEEERFPGGQDIALFDDRARERRYAYLSAAGDGWRVLDVTDPRAPLLVQEKTLGGGGTDWLCRGVAVDQQAGLLAMTEDIRFAGGNQYGYVSFYDLNQDPANPVLVGREKLTEGFTGIPIRVALRGRYAYVATVGAGLQIVDVEAALSNAGPSDGSTIVGGFATLAQGYGSPSDVVLAQGGRAFVVTTGGHLLTLDVSIPQLPRLVSAFGGPGFGITRLAVLSGYNYTDADGVPQLVDLGVAGTWSGGLVTLDLSDTVPRVLGRATDGEGAEATAVVRDVALEGTSGMAFVTTFGAIQVFDLRSPYAPTLIHTLSEYPDAEGEPVPMGDTPALAADGGWIFTANRAVGARVVEVPLEFNLLIRYAPCALDDCKSRRITGQRSGALSAP